MSDVRRTLAGAARYSQRLPVMRMVEWLRMIEAATRDAEAGKPVPLFNWVQDLSHDRVSAHAMVRVLFLILSVKRVSADDIARLTHELKSTTDARRRPVRQPRQPGNRLSPPLW